MDGIVNVNKPRGWSSFKIANRIKKISGCYKAGHAGTLDPDARGVLIILLGEACKVFDLFIQGDKTYDATVKLGWKSTTSDGSGEVEKIENVNFSREQIGNTLNKFKGRYIHKVPEFSAKKHRGKTFYSIKRNGKKPPERTQETQIFDIRLIQYNPPEVRFEVKCSSGTYIRTLAIDLAAGLGTEGYLKDLVRTNVSGFRLEDAVEPDEQHWSKGFININKAMLKFPHIIINNKSVTGIPYGICFKEQDVIEISGEAERNIFGVYSPDRRLLALAHRDLSGNFKLRRVFKVTTEGSELGSN